MLSRLQLCKYVLVAAIALRLLLGFLSTAGMQWDFINFYNAGRRAFHGELQNTYQPESLIDGQPPFGEPRRGFQEFTGFPLTTFLFVPLGPFDPGKAVRVLKFGCAVAFVLAAWLLYRTWSGRLSPPESAERTQVLYLLALLFFEPFWFTFVIGGNSTPIALMFFAAFLWLNQQRQTLWAALALSLALLVKPFLAALVLLFVVARCWGFLFRLGAWLAAEGAVSLLVFGWSIHAQWLQLIQQESARWAIRWWNNSAPVAFFSNFWLYLGSGATVDGLDPAPFSLAVFLACWKGLLILFFGYLAWRARARQQESPELLESLASMGVLFALTFSTVVWPHYLQFLLVPLLFWAPRLAQQSWPVRWLFFLTFLSTIRGNWTLTSYLGRILRIDTIPEVVAGGAYATGTLLLALLLLITLSRNGRQEMPAAS